MSGSGKILNGFEGKQKEYIYFGENNDSPVKWRVLSTGADNKYSKGNMLLWTDKQLAAEKYNYSQRNPDYAYWGTSKMRASLNGGDDFKYYEGSSETADPNTTAKTIATNASWYGKLFNADVKDAVVKASSYTTDSWNIDNGLSQYEYKTKGITDTADNKNGKYNTNRIDDKTNHPTAQYASYATKDGTVWEETSGDYLFLLDYYDINNTDYGFGDSDGTTYAKTLDSNWKESSGYYPGNYTGTGRNPNGKTSDYLKYSGEAADFYWLRPAGRDGTSYSAALAVGSIGRIDDRAVWNLGGVRPAFNLDSTKIAYITATAPTAGGGFAPLTAPTGKPEYKAYVKASNYTSTGKASIREEGNNLYIAYDNPITGVSGGNLLVLLTKKNSTDGAVDYQAAISMSGSTATATRQAAANLSLPWGVSLSTHDVTILYASANGGNSSETIYCSYDVNGGIYAPQNITVTYDNSAKWIANLTSSEKPGWLDLNIYNNTKYVNVDKIEYTAPDAETAVEVTSANVKNAGEYVVYMSLASGLKWAGSTDTQKTFTITINKKPSTPKPKVDSTTEGIPFVTDGLPDLVSDTSGTPGTFDWKEGESAKEGTNSYEWIFTPTDSNFTVESGSIELEFQEREIKGLSVKSYNPTDTVYTTTKLTPTIKSYFVIEATYSDGKTATLSSTEFKLEIKAADKKLVNGTNTLIISTIDGKFPIQYNIDVEEVAVSSISLILMSTTQFTYPVTEDEIKAAITSATVVWNTGSTGQLEDLSILTVSGTLDANPSVTITIGVDGLTIPDYTETITINKGNFDVSGITFTSDTLIYDEGAHSIFYSGTLPEGVSVEYDYNGTKQATPWEFTNAGTYNITLSFTHSNANYNSITTTLPATLKIDKATVTGITFADAVQPEITGTTYTLEATGYPSWVTVEYYYDGSIFTGASAAGEYEITAKFTHSNPNYEQIDDITKTLTISDKPEVEGAGNIVVEPTITATYTGSPVDYSAKNVPSGVEVTYEILKDGQPFEGTDIIDAGTYTITVKFDTGAAYAPIANKPCVITVERADYPDADKITFAGTSVSFGKTVSIVAENIPDGVTVTYVYNGTEQPEPFEFTEINEDGYSVTAKFTHENGNYKPIGEKTAVVKITAAVVESVSAAVEAGAKFDINNTLDDVKAKIKAEISFNNGTKEDVEVADLTVTCETLREGGLLEVGKQIITVTYNDGSQDFTTTVQIEVAKAKVAVPVYSGSLTYSGDEIKPTAADFDGFDSALMAFVESKTVAGLNAGTYKAVFALKDSDRYEWATATTLKKALFTVALYDLSAGEAEVEWTLEKAVITATMGADGKPVFKSDGISAAALAQAVGLKFYADEACTQEVAADALDYETTYYMQADLLDSTNFKLDKTVSEVVSAPYTTPAKQLTVWEKIVKFVVTNWLWIVIAVAALILLILIIALAARSAKKKREREEQRRLEEKEERKREQEERERREEERRQREDERRREEREERMAARMAQPQMMPQMPAMMGGQMPQSMPQQAQAMPMAAGGASSNEIAELKAEMAAMKATQDMAKEIAELRMEVMRAEQNAVMRSDVNALRFGGEQSMAGGVTLQALTELIRTEVRNAMADEKAAAQSATAENAAPVTAQVPPDAVMTTVTTTKIDTTKKPAQPAQNAQAAAPVRTVVRNVVAPMPVDDGRVFDVGGFYKPADPITDMGFTDEENKD
ncbi:MAG: hypothetical protein K2I17_01200 [Clostridia bacterium]|nr:hypothetical protein [Clostridia bacterium]